MSIGTLLYIGGFELPDKNAAAHRVLSIGKIFRELDYHVVFIGIDNHLAHHSKIMTTKKIFMDFECYATPYPKAKMQWIQYLTSIDSFIEVAEMNHDLIGVVCYNYPAVALERIRHYCRKRNIKIFSDCTEWYSSTGNGPVFKLIKGLDSFFRMRIIQKRLDGLILVSRFLSDYYKHQKKIILPPLVDLSEDKWKKPIPVERTKLLRLIYAGSAGRTKDQLRRMIEALFELKDRIDFKLWIVGVSVEEYLETNKDHSDMILEFEERLKFLGRCSHAESIALIKDADFSLFLRESNRVSNAGFPTKFTESISCGTPVITNVTSDLEKYMIEGKNGWFVDNRDIHKLKDQLKNALSTNIKDIQMMKEFCFDAKTFDFHNFIEEFREFLD